MVVLRALPELAKVPPPRLTLPVEVVHEAAVKALYWGFGCGLASPAKREPLFRAAYGEEAEARYPQMVDLVERQAAESLRRGVAFTGEQLLPNRIANHSESQVSASDAWLDLVCCFLLGCAGSTSRPDLIKSALRAWCQQNTARYQWMSSLKTIGTPVPASLLMEPPITPEALEAEITQEATAILREYESKFGPL